MRFRCAAASSERGESIAGTASTVRSFLLVEHPGPWGADVLRDARLPDGLGDHLRARSAAHGTKVLLIRRPAGPLRSAGSDVASGGVAGNGVRVFAGYAHHADPWLETAVLDQLTDVCDLDLEGLARGRSPGLAPHPGPVLAVCTHGRHDVCCAERGRPVAAGLADAFADQTWEASHIGGDRFAANLLALPYGLYFGRLRPETARGVARLLAAGELDLDHLRGRSGLATPLQAAEIALRRYLNERRIHAVRCVSRIRQRGRTEAVFDVAGRRYAVTVSTDHEPLPHLLTCRAARENQAPRHQIEQIRAL